MPNIAIDTATSDMWYHMMTLKTRVRTISSISVALATMPNPKRKLLRTIASPSITAGGCSLDDRVESNREQPSAGGDRRPDEKIISEARQGRTLHVTHRVPASRARAGSGPRSGGPPAPTGPGPLQH